MRTDPGNLPDDGKPHAGHGHGGPQYTRDELVAMRYERRDVNLRGVIRGFLAFIAFVVFGWGAAYVYVWAVGYTDTPNAVNARPKRLPPLPNPLLQNNITAKTDMFELRQMELVRLSGYHYVDGAKTRVSVPIEVAKDVILREGISAKVTGTLPDTGSLTPHVPAAAPGPEPKKSPVPLTPASP